ncbi:MAG: hypothetical protein AAFP77_08480 [Bacteroidota bacterium]
MSYFARIQGRIQPKAEAPKLRPADPVKPVERDVVVDPFEESARPTMDTPSDVIPGSKQLIQPVGPESQAMMVVPPQDKGLEPPTAALDNDPPRKSSDTPADSISQKEERILEPSPPTPIIQQQIVEPIGSGESEEVIPSEESTVVKEQISITPPLPTQVDTNSLQPVVKKAQEELSPRLEDEVPLREKESAQLVMPRTPDQQTRIPHVSKLAPTPLQPKEQEELPPVESPSQPTIRIGRINVEVIQPEAPAPQPPKKGPQKRRRKQRSRNNSNPLTSPLRYGLGQL